MSRPINHQSPMQCWLIFLENISRARCARLLSICPLHTLFLSFLPVGCDRVGLVSSLITALSMYFSLRWSSLLFQVYIIFSIIFRSFSGVFVFDRVPSLMCMGRNFLRGLLFCHIEPPRMICLNIYFIFLSTSSLTKWLFISILFSFHLFVNIPNFCNCFNLLWLDKMFIIISTFLILLACFVG